MKRAWTKLSAYYQRFPRKALSFRMGTYCYQEIFVQSENSTKPRMTMAPRRLIKLDLRFLLFILHLTDKSSRVYIKLNFKRKEPKRIVVMAFINGEMSSKRSLCVMRVSKRILKGFSPPRQGFGIVQGQHSA